MREFDARWVRLAVAAGAVVGSALVSSVAVAADESLPIEPPPTLTPDVDSPDVDPSSADVIVIDAPFDTPFEDVAVIEIVAPEPDVIESEATEPAIVETLGTAAETASSSEEASDVVSSAPVPLASPVMGASEPGSPGTLEPGSEHEGGSGGHGGSGGQGNPYRMTFEVIWFDAEGKQITALEVVFPPEVLAQFKLSASSQTGQGKATTATCTYPSDSAVLRCVFDNPGHGSGPDGLVVPARPTASYTVVVDWPLGGWTISGANDDAYSARDRCPRGVEGGSGGGEAGGGGVSCVHTVVMRPVASSAPPTEPPIPPPVQESGVVPPVVTSPAVSPTAPAPRVQSAAVTPGSLPATGGSISMLLLIAGVLVAVGSAAVGLTRRTS